jgi:hypothetical protein
MSEGLDLCECSGGKAIVITRFYVESGHFLDHRLDHFLQPLAKRLRLSEQILNLLVRIAFGVHR